MELESLMLPVIIFQEYPDIALLVLSGLRNIPPHEATIMYAMNSGAPTNVVEASRGTAKTATVMNLFASLKALLTPKKKLVTLNATGFRGGQLIFNDTEKLFQGGWDGQDSDQLFFKHSCKDPNAIVNHGPNMWTIKLDNFSTNVTLPTNDFEKIRGTRGHLLFIDEANIVEWELVEEVADAFLNVKGDFDHGGAKAEANQIFFVSTVDFNWRPFQNLIRASLSSYEREMQARRAMAHGDMEEYTALQRQGLHGYCYVRFDYTDLLIREFIVNHEGRRFRVHWPNPNIELMEDIMGIPFTERDSEGYITQFGAPLKFYSTYPIDKRKLEQPLFDGTADTASWLAEQRNVVDTSTGDVYPHGLVDRACNEGTFSILPYAKCPPEYQKAFAETSADYCAPVLWQCSDPCVLGVDYARESDFAAFVVIRLGPSSSGSYDYLTHHGYTPWCNVIWAEQHRNMTHKEVATKIRELAGRYNFSYYHEDHVVDPWMICRGIGIDMRGGGNGVRDSLALLDEDANNVPASLYRIYDPNDRDERIQAFAQDPKAKPMLDAIWPSGELNDRMVTFTVAQMEQKLLYIGKYISKTSRIKGDRRLDPGYEGVNGLNYQLRRIKSEPAANWRRFFVEGDTKKTTNKKDYWAAFIYAAKQARAHIIRTRSVDDVVPPTAALVTTVNKFAHKNRAAGVRDGFNRFGSRRYL